jgi:cob(I)alamin adenosyltransferase
MKTTPPSVWKTPHSLVYIYTGEGKGKTSAALGTVVRSLAVGWNVSWIAFYKQAEWGISEYDFPNLLQTEYRSRLTMLLLGKGFYISQAEHVIKQGTTKVKLASIHNAKAVDSSSPDEHRLAATSAFDKAMEILTADSPPQLLVLDEICNAVSDKLLEQSAVLELIRTRGKTHLILTGRNASPQLIEAADLVTSMTKIKHPYDEGRFAVKGLDY